MKTYQRESALELAASLPLLQQLCKSASSVVSRSYGAQRAVDLFALLWKLPILNAVGSPAKYFASLPLLSACVLAGQGIHAL